MIRTEVFKKVTDSDAQPYIEQKDVILCRSGIQYYHNSEIASFITEDNKPPKEKEWYKEYRPANVVVKAKKLCGNLPVTKEHPSDWVTPDNWKEFGGGVTGKEVEVEALDGEADGEIGLKSDITFYDKDLYEYYQKHKEVSLGYTCKKHFVDNPEEVGYDILLDEITEVNHLAITQSGRGGSSVAVIDSLIGGMKPMRTGIWAWLAGKKQTDSKTALTFGKEVFTALKNSKGSTEEELANELKGVFDSCAILKDCPQKDTMLNMIRDCYDNREKALENEEELTKTFDSMYVSLSGDSLKEIVDAVKGLGGCTVATSDSSDKKDDEPSKTEDSGKKDDEPSKTDDSDNGKKDDEGKNTDSGKAVDSAPLTKEDIAKIVKDSIAEIVPQMVKDTLGIKDGKAKVEGGVIDSNTDTPYVAQRDYTEFLE